MTSTMDRLAEKYYHLSPYLWCGGNPIKFSDPDGRLVVFINGMNINSGGTKLYWNGVDKIIQDYFKDNKSIYIDGSCGGIFNTVTSGLVTGNLNPKVREIYGNIMGKKLAESIYENLGDKETIKVATHSMGAAFAKGFISGLQSYARANGIVHKVVLELDMAPFQPTLQKTCESVPTIVISHKYDNIARALPMPNAYNNITRTDKSPWNILKEHSISSFTREEIKQCIEKFFSSK